MTKSNILINIISIILIFIIFIVATMTITTGSDNVVLVECYSGGEIIYSGTGEGRVYTSNTSVKFTDINQHENIIIGDCHIIIIES